MTEQDQSAGPALGADGGAEGGGVSKSILVVEDEPVLRQTLVNLLVDEGYDAEEADDGTTARDKVLERGYDLVVTDIRMGEMDGLTLVGHLQKVCPQTPVIIMTAYGTVESAVSAMKSGVYDYLLKPVNFDDLLMKIERALEYGEARRTQQVLTEQLAEASTFHNLIGSAPSMRKLFETVRKLATVKSSVLIVGESGTGKELFARAIHYNGITRDKPFVPVNCGAIPDTLIESELFGYRRGAFTGAQRDKVGYFEAANHGTLFLDEISTLPVGVQASLLRVLEERAVVPVGDTRPRPIDVRIVAASNRDLQQMVKEEQFREDLLYRLNVVTIELPPLRQRKEDIPDIVHHFLEKYTKEMNKRVEGVSNGAMRAMLSHDWPGNVRELENVIERAVIFAEGRQVEPDDLPFVESGAVSAAGAGGADGENLKEAMAHFERQHILWSLRQHDYDKTETARHLGIGVSSLYRKLDELDIPKNEGEGE